ncbi:MAG: hypothetical protein IRY91_13225 [Gemmatimonadaceae bacterium]|nr:hypothetical protein [Gemmatimonadaceae bacterium]
MLSYASLQELERELRGQVALTMYVDGSVEDPAAHTPWRVALEDAIAAQRAALAESPEHEQEDGAGRAVFERCVYRLREELALRRAAPRSAGYVAFIGAEGAVHAGPLPGRVPSLVAWERGIRVAPYLRVIASFQPAIVAVVQTSGAQLYRVEEETCERIDAVRTHARLRPVYHVGDDGPHERSGPATRGRTAVDEVRRVTEAGLVRMVAELAERIVCAVGSDAWVVIGGAPEAARRTVAALPPALAARTWLAPMLSRHASDAEIVRAARRGVATLRERQDKALVDAVMEQAAADGLGVIRADRTVYELHERTVQELVLTPHFIEKHPGAAETAIRAAFDQRARAVVVSGDAAARLDTVAGGIGARLRFARCAGPVR